MNEEILGAGSKENILGLFWRSKNKKEKSIIVWGLAIFLIFLVFIFYSVFIKAPSNFPTGEIITINTGSNLTQAGNELVSKNVIKSLFWFRGLVILFDGDDGLIAGDYYFKKPTNLFSVIAVMTDENYNADSIKITIPEGFSTKQMAEVFEEKLPNFNKGEFLDKTFSLEGYLFPDTYFFSSTTDENTVIGVMQDNFQKKIDMVADKISAFGKSLEEVITMASIIELEGKNMEDRRIISGILWDRISLDVALQVDASFLYLLGKESADLTIEDLSIDSRYNTYKYRGLPPGALTNPGLESIIAAITPEKTDYFFYLFGKDEAFHYAESFEGHKINKEKYLR